MAVFALSLIQIRVLTRKNLWMPFYIQMLMYVDMVSGFS